MTDQATDAPAAPVETAEEAAARIAAEAAAAAKKAHEDAVALLKPELDAALGKLEELRTQLLASFGKATDDPSHLDYAGSFVRDVQLKGEEIVAWIKRHV